MAYHRHRGRERRGGAVRRAAASCRSGLRDGTRRRATRTPGRCAADALLLREVPGRPAGAATAPVRAITESPSTTAVRAAGRGQHHSVVALMRDAGMNASGQFHHVNGWFGTRQVGGAWIVQRLLGRRAWTPNSNVGSTSRLDQRPAHVRAASALQRGRMPTSRALRSASLAGAAGLVHRSSRAVGFAEGAALLTGGAPTDARRAFGPGPGAGRAPPCRWRLSRFSYALLLPPMRADLGWSYRRHGGRDEHINAAGYLGALSVPPLSYAGDTATRCLGRQRAWPRCC